MNDVERACHYTSTQGLISIIQSHTLWASSASFMNDADEMRSGALAFRHEFERRRDALSPDEIKFVNRSGLLDSERSFHRFLLSAARDFDSLTLWRNYGVSEVAYSIELDASVALVPLEVDPGTQHPAPPHDFYTRQADDHEQDGTPIYFDPEPDLPLTLGGEWKTVDYIDGVSDPKIGRRLDELLHGFRASRSSRRASVVELGLHRDAPLDFMKDNGFADEREVRSVHWVAPWWKFVRYRASRFGPVPYIQVTSPENDDDYAVVAKRLPIRSITIGPNAPFAAHMALRALLDQNGYGNIRIRRSQTPYR